MRIGHTCKLLIDKKMTALQACYQNGFRTLSNFKRQFKAATHHTPTTYKEGYQLK
ncbi:hypothetical protein B4Q04_21315 [Zobellia sp. OII3]|nr:hypothetical protein B4Q04_21315 [Zobellia sp. OII3]